MISFYENFLFIKQVLKNAFKVDVKILTYPYTSNMESDYGLRKIFWKDFEYNDDLLESLQQLPANQIICLNSKLGFNNILYRVPNTYEDCMLFIGPFLAEEINTSFISDIIKENNFSINFIEAIRTYYQTLPYVDELTIINTLQTLLSHLIPNFIFNNIKTYDFSTLNKINLIPEVEASLNFTMELYEDYISIHNSLFQQIGQNNYENIYKDLEYYIQKTGILNENNIDNIKYFLDKFNINCEFIVLQKKVHYFYIERIFLTFKRKIQVERNRDRLLLLPYEMIKKYCIAVQNHSLAQYSHTVRSAINYINFNLHEPLSLSYISSKINKNASFLSNQFKKETGQTITNFIHKRRIEYATNLLNSTSLNIQEIAEKVGILELNYFSKLFKKYIGMSPTEYKKSI